MDNPIQRKTYIIQRGEFIQYAHMALDAEALAQAIVTAAQQGISFREANDEEVAALEAIVVIDSFRLKVDPYLVDLEAEQCDWDDIGWKEPLPRPPKTKLRINQAPKQSFRQSMRSVNRNR